MVRIISLVLALCMALPLLFACSGDSGDNKPNSSSTNSATTTAAPEDAITTYLEPLSDEIKELDYGDETITIIARSDEKWAKDEIWVEELSNDPVKDAIYNRNTAVEELLGVKITQVLEDGQTELQNKVDIMVNSGDDSFDIVAGSVAYGTPMIQKGLMYNLYENGIETYLDATKPWWAQQWIEEAEMGDKLYCITGAPALSLSRLMFVVYYNKTMGENHGIEDLYEVVNRGDWTIDYCSELISGIYRDLNGNDLKDEEDEYGLAINHYENCDMFWSAFDMNMITKDGDGWYEIATQDKEKISIAFEKVYALIRENSGTYDTIDTKGFNLARDMFSNGTVLLAPLHLKYAESEQFRNMQDEYGILPVPKYDEKQDTYYTYAHDQYTVFMVPITVKDPVMSGAVLEAMAYESYKTVQPTYYNIVLKGRYANDPQSRQLLDIITTNTKVDPSYIYGRIFGLPAASVFRDLIYDGQKSFASNYATQERMLPKLLNILKRDIEALEY